MRWYSNGNPLYKYKFGGKELQTELNLNTYDFHARQQDPQLGRFWGVDPKTDKLPEWSPFNYTLNNPISTVDPDGKWPIPAEFYRAFSPLQSSFNSTRNSINSNINSIKSNSNQFISDVGSSISKFTNDNKSDLLRTVNTLKSTGDLAKNTGAGMAIVGAAFSGVGATPGIAVAGAGALISGMGTALEIGINYSTNNQNNAKAQVGNELTHIILNAVGVKMIDQMIPIKTPSISKEVKEATKQTLGIFEDQFKSVSDKTLKRINE